MNEQRRIDRLEERVDDVLAAARREARADFRLLILAFAVLMLAVMILGFAANVAAGS
jgi:hypothetical protein